MKAIIPAAGEGTRLRPHTYHLPKALISVGGKPILGHIVDTLIDSGIDDIAFIVGYKGDKIKDYIQDEYPSLSCKFFVQEEINGIAGAVKLAESYLVNEPVLIVLGDTVFETDLNAVLVQEYSSLAVKEVDDPRRFGVAELDGDGFITTLVEKPSVPKSKIALAGIYYIKNGEALRSAIEKLMESNIKQRNEFQITDALQIMIDNGEKTRTFELQGWYDCGKFETLLETNEVLLSKVNANHKFENSVIKDKVFIGENVEISNSIIGNYTAISKGSIIRNSVIERSIIGENAEISNANLLNSVIGNNTTLNEEAKSVNICDHSDLEQ